MLIQGKFISRQNKGIGNFTFTFSDLPQVFFTASLVLLGPGGSSSYGEHLENGVKNGGGRLMMLETGIRNRGLMK